MKLDVLGFTKRAARKLGLRALELKDLARRRRTEKPHLTGFFHKSQVVIGPVTAERDDGGEYFRAKFVKGRLGTIFNPYPDHTVGLALEVASYQTAVAGLKKFNGAKGVVLASAGVEYKNRGRIPPDAKITLNVRKTRERNLNGNKMLFFKTLGVDEKSGKEYFEGEFSIFQTPKNKNG